MQVLDFAKVRREGIRWYLLVALNHARPEGCLEVLLVGTIQSIFTDSTQIEVRRELDYLEDRDLVEIKRSQVAPWHACLTRYGVDVAEYTIDCEPGIGRPPRTL